MLGELAAVQQTPNWEYRYVMTMNIYFHRSLNPIAENDLSNVFKWVLSILKIDELQTEPTVAQYLRDFCDMIATLKSWLEI